MSKGRTEVGRSARARLQRTQNEGASGGSVFRFGQNVRPPSFFASLGRFRASQWREPCLSHLSVGWLTTPRQGSSTTAEVAAQSAALQADIAGIPAKSFSLSNSRQRNDRV